MFIRDILSREFCQFFGLQEFRQSRGLGVARRVSEYFAEFFGRTRDW